MRDADAITLLLEIFPRGLGKGHASMLTAGAPDGDGELLLALRHVPGHDAIEQRTPALLELLGFRSAQHVISHRLVKAGEGTQLGIVVRIGKESHVHDQIGIHGNEYTVTCRPWRSSPGANSARIVLRS